MDLKTLTSPKGKTMLVVNEFRFYLDHQNSKGTQRYRCCSSACICYANNATKSSTLNHNHGHPDPSSTARKALAQSLRGKAVENLSVRPATLIAEEIRVNSPQALQLLKNKDMDLIRRSVYRAKRSSVPTLSKSLEETQMKMEEMDVRTSTGENRNTFVTSWPN